MRASALRREAGLLAVGGRCREGWAKMIEAYEAEPRLMALYAEGEFTAAPAHPDEVPDDQVLAWLNRALKSEPDFKEALAWRGLLKRRALRYQDSAADLGRAWKLGLRRALVATLLGEARLQIGDAAGMKDLEAALKRPDAEAWNFAWCGRAKVAFGRDKRALRFLDRAVALDPEDGWNYAWRAEAKRLLRAPGALADFDKALSMIAVQAHRAFCLTWRAMALAEKGDHEGALRDLDAALALLADYGPARQGRARSLRALGRVKEWFADFDRAARLDPKYLALFCSSSPEQLAEYERDFGTVKALAWRGLARLLQGKSREALSDLDDALRAASKDARLYAWRGQAFHQLGEAIKALEDFDRALALNPKDALTFANRAKLQLQLGRADKALADLDRAIGLDDRQAAFFADRGCVKMLLRDCAGAVADLEHVALRDGRYARVFADLSAACGRLGEKKKERSYRKRALVLDRKQALERLRTWKRHWTIRRNHQPGHARQNGNPPRGG